MPLVGSTCASKCYLGEFHPVQTEEYTIKNAIFNQVLKAKQEKMLDTHYYNIYIYYILTDQKRNTPETKNIQVLVGIKYVWKM